MPASSPLSESPSNPPSIVSLAASHGLELQPDSIRLEEAGLDFRVASAAASDGTEWVLRVPRRADVAAKLEEEARTLALIPPRVSLGRFIAALHAIAPQEARRAAPSHSGIDALTTGTPGSRDIAASMLDPE